MSARGLPSASTRRPEIVEPGFIFTRTVPPVSLGGSSTPTSPFSGCWKNASRGRRGSKAHTVKPAFFSTVCPSSRSVRPKLQSPISGLPSGASSLPLNVEPGSSVTSRLIDQAPTAGSIRERAV